MSNTRGSLKCLCSSQEAKCDICQSQEAEPYEAASLEHLLESQSVEKEVSQNEVCSAAACKPTTSLGQPNSDQNRCIKLLITGKSGNGKSVIINGIAGQKVIPERKGVKLEPRSASLEHYHRLIGNIDFFVWSSAHLQDQDKRIDRQQYLKELKDACSDVHIIIYCLNMTDTRFLPGNSDITAMKDLTELFGENCWKKTVFALTYANLAAVEAFAPDDDEDDSDAAKYKAFQDGVSTWTEIIEDVLRNDINVTLPLKIKAVPTGHYKKPELPDRICWLSYLFMECGIMMPEDAQDALVEINLKRFSESRTDAHGKKSYEQQILIAIDAAKKKYFSFVSRIKKKKKLH